MWLIVVQGSFSNRDYCTQPYSKTLLMESGWGRDATRLEVVDWLTIHYRLAQAVHHLNRASASWSCQQKVSLITTYKSYRQLNATAWFGTYAGLLMVRFIAAVESAAVVMWFSHLHARLICQNNCLSSHCIVVSEHLKQETYCMCDISHSYLQTSTCIIVHWTQPLNIIYHNSDKLLSLDALPGWLISSSV